MLKNSMFVLILVFGVMSHAEIVTPLYECVPSTPTPEIEKIVVEQNEKNQISTVLYVDIYSVSVPSEYGDDVDTIYYFSQFLDTQIEFVASDMQTTGTAQGTYIENMTFKNGPVQKRTDMICKDLR